MCMRKNYRVDEKGSASYIVSRKGHVVGTCRSNVLDSTPWAFFSSSNVYFLSSGSLAVIGLIDYSKCDGVMRNQNKKSIYLYGRSQGARKGVQEKAMPVCSANANSF